MDRGFINIISADALFNYLGHPDWVVIDTRFDLSQPEWGRSNYLEGHIPGAVYADLDKDLSGAITPQSSRHPLSDSLNFIHTAQKLGISNSSQVVIYDTVGGAFASRLWWMLKYYGHPKVAVLDGGYTYWINHNYPVSSGESINPVGNFDGTPHENMLATTRDVTEMVSKSTGCLIDARSPQRYIGSFEPIDPIAGHIPGAINRFHQLNLLDDFRLLPAYILKSQFAELISGHSIEEVVVYCGSGVTSCHHLLALEIAGLSGARLYAGSWSEWIRSPVRPISFG